MEKFVRKENRGFASISTDDGRYRIWIPRPTTAGTMYCTCGFGLRGHMPFVDAIDRLPYLQVQEVNQIDEDFSAIVIRCTETPYRTCMERMLDDLPRLMDEELVERVLK